MGTVCTSLNDKKYSRMKRNESVKMSSQIEGCQDNSTNMKMSKDFQVYQFIKKENQNDLLLFINSNEIDINDYIFNNEINILHRAIKLKTSANYIEFLFRKDLRSRTLK
jgi:hypothetical protein